MTDQNTLIVKSLDAILDKLQFNPRNPILRVKIEDGREVVLIQPNSFTISRIYVSGRPDGKKPFGKDSYLEYYKGKLDEYVANHKSDEGFQLDAEQWQLLFNESYERYIRYFFFSGIKQWKEVEADTNSNMTVADMAKKFASKDIAWGIYQYKGYMLMMNTTAKAEIALMKGDYNAALQHLDEGIEKIGQYCGECLREERPDVEAITREKYLANLIQFREDIQSVSNRLNERLRGRRVSLEDEIDDLLREN